MVARQIHALEVAGSNPVPATMGSVAQLGEHLPCKQEAEGSSPSRSTRKENKMACKGKGKGKGKPRS